MTVLQRLRRIEYKFSKKSGKVIILIDRELDLMTTIFKDVEDVSVANFAKLFDTNPNAIMEVLNRDYINRYKEREEFVLNHKDVKRILSEVANE